MTVLKNIIKGFPNYLIVKENILKDTFLNSQNDSISHDALLLPKLYTLITLMSILNFSCNLAEIYDFKIKLLKKILTDM